MVWIWLWINEWMKNKILHVNGVHTLYTKRTGLRTNWFPTFPCILQLRTLSPYRAQTPKLPTAKGLRRAMSDERGRKRQSDRWKVIRGHSWIFRFENISFVAFTSYYELHEVVPCAHTIPFPIPIVIKRFIFVIY